MKLTPSPFGLGEPLRLDGKRSLEPKERDDGNRAMVATVVVHRMATAHVTIESEPAVLDGLAEGALVLQAVQVFVLDVIQPLDEVGELHGAHGAGELAAAAGGVLLQVGQDKASQLGGAERPLLVGG